jgi:hypothetical protein
VWLGDSRFLPEPQLVAELEQRYGSPKRSGCSRLPW